MTTHRITLIKEIEIKTDDPISEILTNLENYIDKDNMIQRIGEEYLSDYFEVTIDDKPEDYIIGDTEYWPDEEWLEELDEEDFM